MQRKKKVSKLEKANEFATVGLILAVGWFIGVMSSIGLDCYLDRSLLPSHRYHASEHWHGKTEAGRKFAEKMGAL